VLGVEAQGWPGRCRAGGAGDRGQMSKTVRQGRDEAVEAGVEPDGRVRGPRPAGRAWPWRIWTPALIPALEALVDPGTRGDHHVGAALDDEVDRATCRGAWPALRSPGDGGTVRRAAGPGPVYSLQGNARRPGG